MKFCWVTITVKDMEESVKFYQEIVGLSENRRFNAGPEVEIVFLGNGETEIELIHNGSSKNVDMGSAISLGFEVNSIEEKFEFIEEKGLSVIGRIFQPNQNVKFFYVMDPNGLKIQFVENIIHNS